MGIGLMTDIPDDLVLWKIETQIKPDRELHDTEIRCEMSAVFAGFLYDKFSYLTGELVKLSVIQLFEIIRKIDFIKKHN